MNDAPPHLSSGTNTLRETVARILVPYYWGGFENQDRHEPDETGFRARKNAPGTPNARAYELTDKILAAIPSPIPQIAGGVREAVIYTAELNLNGKYTWCIVEAFPRIENVIEEFGYGPDAYKAAQEKLAARQAALSPQAQAGETRPFYGAECPSYPACEGGCGLGCTKEIERSRHSAQPSSGCAEPDINPDGDSVNHDQAIFDAICAATSHSMFLAAGAITIDTQKFIETFNKHRDRGLCTSLSVAQPPIVLEALRLAWTCLNEMTDDDPSQYAISKGKIAAAISSVSSTRRASPDEPRDALGQTASEVYSSAFAPPTLREALENLLKDIDESQALGMPVLLRRDTIAGARAAFALSSTLREVGK